MTPRVAVLSDGIESAQSHCLVAVVRCPQFEAGADKFMILGTDGVFEFISSQEAVSIVAKFDDPQEVCTIRDHAAAR